jgi:predicted metal-dependent phosphoesterase TrpH
MPFRCLFHLHTRHSFDSFLAPKTIVARARALGVHVLIVTDHNTIQGAVEAQSICGARLPLVVIAAEYQSEKGDIIGLFLKTEIRSQRSDEIVREIHEQQGLVVLPHPFKAHRLDDALLAEADLIETYNGRCSAYDNAQAADLANRTNRLTIAGADAHCAIEVDSAITEFSGEPPRSEEEFRRQLLTEPRRAITKSAPAICRPYSQLVKAFKTRDTRLFLYQAKRMAFMVARREGR